MTPPEPSTSEDEQLRNVWRLLESASYQIRNHGGEPEHDTEKLIHADAMISKAQNLIDNLRYRLMAGGQTMRDNALEEAAKAAQSVQNCLGNSTHGYHCGFLSGKEDAAEAIRALKQPASEIKG